MVRYSFGKSTDYTGDWIAIDTETGGLDPTRHALLSIAVWSPTYQDSWLCRPLGACEAEAMKINGLDARECAENGLKPRESAERLMVALRGKAIVGQNVGFDLGFIASRIFGLKPGDDAMLIFRSMHIIDTHDIFKRLHPDAPCHLHEIAEHYGLGDKSRFHDAAYDAEMTGRVYMAMQEEMRGDLDGMARREA